MVSEVALARPNSPRQVFGEFRHLLCDVEPRSLQLRENPFVQPLEPERPQVPGRAECGVLRVNELSTFFLKFCLPLRIRGVINFALQSLDLFADCGKSRLVQNLIWSCVVFLGPLDAPDFNKYYGGGKEFVRSLQQKPVNCEARLIRESRRLDVPHRLKSQVPHSVETKLEDRPDWNCLGNSRRSCGRR